MSFDRHLSGSLIVKSIRTDLCREAQTRFRKCLVALVLAHGIAVGVVPAGAQTDSTGTSSMAMPVSARRWSGTLNGTMAYQSVVAEGVSGPTLGVQAAGGVTYAAGRSSITLDGDVGYLRAEPDPASVDRWGLGLGGRHELAPRILLLGRTSYEVSRIQNLDYRSITLAGVGVVVIQTPTVSWIVAPGLGYTRSVQTDYGRILSFANDQPPGVDGIAAGVHDMLMVQLTPMLSLQQTILWLRGLGSTAYDQVRFEARLTGMVSKGLGLTIAFQHQFDSSMPPPVERALQSLNSGIQVSF
jgi:putative salt-induced outer membrane protein YdiY